MLDGFFSQSGRIRSMYEVEMKVFSLKIPNSLFCLMFDDFFLQSEQITISPFASSSNIFMGGNTKCGTSPHEQKVHPSQTYLR
jgi:hypothetical protein